MKRFYVLLGLVLFVVFNPFRPEPDYSNAEVVKVPDEEPVRLAHESEVVGHEVHLTVYHAVVEQCNEDPEHTSTMFKLDLSNPYKHRIIALSRDLLKKFPYHSKVRVIGAGKHYDGIYTVEDTMNERYTERADILINEGMPLLSKKGVKIVEVK